MNMKKSIGVCVTLLAALLCAVPQSSAESVQPNAGGKIRAVEVEDPNGQHTFPNVGEGKRPMTVNETVYIRFHLVNLGWSNTVANAAYTDPWFFKYTGPSLTGDDAMDQKILEKSANRPRLGLWVSGGVREAELVQFPLAGASDWLSDVLDGERHYTDLVFAYTVQPGDLALPIQLANASGTGPATGYEPYYLKCNSEDVPWILADSQTKSVYPAFAFGPSILNSDVDFAGDGLYRWNQVARERENTDLDLSKAGVYVQAIDFDANYFNEDSGIWRSIAKGSTTADPGAPTIQIQGGAAKSMSLYVWTDNTNIAEIVKAGQVVEVKSYKFGDDQWRTVGKVNIVAEDESVPISIKATGETNLTTQVFLSAVPTNIYNASGGIITNFIARTVQVGEPLPPSIQVTVDGQPVKTVTANADYLTSLVGVNVELSEPWPGPNALQIPIKLTLKDDPAQALTDYVGLSISSVNDNTAWDNQLTVQPGATSASGSLWMYGNRGTAQTANGILVEVATNDLAQAAREFFTGKFTAATVMLNPSTPAVDELATISAEANTPQEVTIRVADAYGELRDPCKYTVYWSQSGNDSPSYYTQIPNLQANASGEITFSVTYMTRGDYTSKFYVVNQDGKASSKHDVSVSVAAQKVVEAVLTQSRFAEDVLNAQDALKVTFSGEGFAMPNGVDSGYLFLVPRDANSSNLVSCADYFGEHWDEGITVNPGETETALIPMYMLDGSTKGITVSYDIMVRTAERWDDGDVVATWSSKPFSFVITNVVPAVTQVSMSGSRLSQNGGVMGARAALGVAKIFTAVTTEPSDEDLNADPTDEMKAFATEWSFDYGNGTPDTFIVYGPPTTPLTNTFTQAGTCTVTVRMRDKDMDRSRDVWGPEFTFRVNVDSRPSITLTPLSGLDSFNEDSIGRQLGRINVNLSMAPSTNITVHIDVRRAGSDSEANYPLPVLNSYDVEFGGAGGNATEGYVYFELLDGTPLGGSSGYILTAAVTNTTVNADGMAWTNLYGGTTLPITINNLAPEILTNPGTNEVRKAENETFSIPFTMRDVPADVAAGLTLTWSTSEGDSETTTITKEGTGQYVVYSGASPNFSFKSAGSKVVTLLVEDKDGLYAQQSWYFYVMPSKSMIIYPRQPDQLSGRGGNLSAFSAYYTGAAGLGDGRVWTTDGAVVDFANFIHKYTFDPTVPSANVYARGYKVGDVDDGALLPGPDIVLDANGGHYKNGTYSSYYTSRELRGRDSYFYCWILNTTGEGGGGYTGSLLNGTLNPVVEVKGQHVADGHQRVTLPDYEEEAESYDPTELEAIFSKERYPADNVGDINEDGIPDVYAVSRTYGWAKDE